MENIENKIKVLELEIDLLSKSLNKLKEEVEADSKGMCNIKGEIAFKAFGCDSNIEPRASGKYCNCGLWLDKRFTWEIVQDDWKRTCLIITGLDKEEI